ncbi:Putative resolvase [Corynebacterium glyciniphilum AJ 3170]|uniref:Putative resolvase n=1 Tax=Corynebacterium glyciniphilum AJ 3170 TaxID=1404245 RepID=X5DTC7_9CORY|nr:magnesium chelatase domain-containing protein [Corynebacterium glyciniphilum]AHW63912.1 Putative resolvase [Corynebacterium glyciniphilum AJ 3170]
MTTFSEHSPVRVGQARGMALSGVSGTPVMVECDISRGLPGMSIVGLGDTAVVQARDRVRSAMINSGLEWPKSRVVMSLSPASVPKRGSGFDLPMVLAILVAQRVVPAEESGSTIVIGELGLDGTVRPVDGVLPMLLAADRAGFCRAAVPRANRVEASRAARVTGLEVAGLAHLRDLAPWIRGELVEGIETCEPDQRGGPLSAVPGPDLSEVCGQEEARRGLEIAAAGGHHLWLSGPPGSGKPDPVSGYVMTMTPTQEQPQQVRAAIYCRISRDKGGEGLGVERQEQACRALAEREGWTVTKVYADNSISAYSGAKRPGYRSLLDAVARGEFDRVVAWAPDRLHRRPIELNEYIDATEQVGVSTHTVNAGHWDLSTAGGRMSARVLGDLAAYESELRAERVLAAQLQARRSGKPRTDGRRSFGYHFVDGEYIVDEREAEALREAARQILAGVSLRQVALRMADEGITSTRGNPMNPESLRDTIKTPRVAGLVSWNPRDRKGKRLRHNRQILDGVTGQWQPILDVDTWRAVCDVLDNPAKEMNRRGNKNKHLGSGIYRCECGDSLQIKYKTRADGTQCRRYTCRRREPLHAPASGFHSSIHGDNVDETVVEVVLQRLEQTDIRAHLALTSGRVDEVSRLTDKRAQVRQRLDDLDDQVALGAITPAAYARVAPKVEQQVAELDAQLAELAGHDNALAPLAETDDVRQWWAGADLDLRRAVLRSLVDITIMHGTPGRKTFDPDRVVFRWKTGDDPAGAE